MSAVSEDKKSSEGGLWEFIKVLFQALLIALVIRTVLFQPFNIPSGSLVPTLLIGDYLFVSKYSYGFSKYSLPDFRGVLSYVGLEKIADLDKLPSGRIWAAEPKLGEIAVFKFPNNTQTDYIKRVIGTPGDRIQMIGGILHINGQAVKREPVAPVTVRNAKGNIEPARDKDGNTVAQALAYRETLPNGVTHLIVEKDGDNGTKDNTPEYVVPPGHYFMMGDNRDDSQDSRFLEEVGYVPLDNFVGKAQVIFFSVEEGSSAWQFWKWPWTVRTERLFTFVQ